jgi:flagellar hook assembly protein FlgD
VYTYRLKQVDLDGTFEHTDVLTVEVTAPDDFSIGQNYPNPFNPTTTFRYELPEQANVRLQIYNTLGQEVQTLINQDRTAGIHTIVWNGLNDRYQPVNSGVYFYRFTAIGFSRGSYTKTGKVILLK